MRQVGSSFKPYVYTTVIDGGASPDDTILDEPVSFETSSGPYTPHNYDEKFEGIITLRRALAQSRNIPALKLANKVGIKSVIDYAGRFGVTSKMPPYLPVALGSAEITLIEQTSAYSVFPNDGVRVTPRYITRVTDYDGRVLEEDFPEVKDVISERTARIMTSMLREVVLHGTGVAAAKLPFPVAGKTGTTNDFTDAWFMGFSPTMTCGVWVGYDEKKSLGAKETGAHAALPIWMNFMTVAMAGKDVGDFQPSPLRRMQRRKWIRRMRRPRRKNRTRRSQAPSGLQVRRDHAHCTFGFWRQGPSPWLRRVQDDIKLSASCWEVERRNEPTIDFEDSIVFRPLVPAIAVPSADAATDRSAIEHVLRTQQEAWNRHDLDAFMTGTGNRQT